MNSISEHPKKTMWQALKIYINNLENNKVFSRQEMFSGIYKFEVFASEDTADIYRFMLCNIGVLSHVGWGKYKKLRDIPESLKTQQLYKIAYKTNWQSWFTPLEMLNELID